MSRSPTRRETLAAAAGLAAMTAAGGALALAEPAPSDMSLGNPKAKVRVVEYASLSCPHCAHFNETIFPAFKSKYIESGRVHYTLRELLTPPVQVAAAGFLMARCAGPSKYFSVVDQVFRSQSRWETGKIKPILVEIAKANGLTEAQFDACLSDEKGAAALQDRMRLAQADGVNSTPTFFVNGKLVEVTQLSDLDAAIAAAGKK